MHSGFGRGWGIRGVTGREKQEDAAIHNGSTTSTPGIIRIWNLQTGGVEKKPASPLRLISCSRRRGTRTHHSMKSATFPDSMNFAP